MASTLESLVRVEERFVEPEKPVDREKVSPSHPTLTLVYLKSTTTQPFASNRQNLLSQLNLIQPITPILHVCFLDCFLPS